MISWAREEKKNSLGERGQDKSPLGVCAGSRCVCGERITQPSRNCPDLYTSPELRDKVRVIAVPPSSLPSSFHASRGTSSSASLRFSGPTFMLCAPLQRGEFPPKVHLVRLLVGGSFGQCLMSFFPPDFGQCPKSIPYFFPSLPPRFFDRRPWIKSLPTFRLSLQPTSTRRAQ